MSEDPKRLPPPPRMEDKDPEDLVHLGGPVGDATASLWVYGDHLDPDEITRFLNCKPNESYRKGDVVPSSRYHILRRTGAWGIISDKAEGAPLNEQVLGLLDRVTKDGNVWEDLVRRFNVEVSCGVFLEEWNRGCDFSREVLRRLADIQAELRFDIYGPDSSLPPKMRGFMRSWNRDSEE